MPAAVSRRGAYAGCCTVLHTQRSREGIAPGAIACTAATYTCSTPMAMASACVMPFHQLGVGVCCPPAVLLADYLYQQRSTRRKGRGSALGSLVRGVLGIAGAAIVGGMVVFGAAAMNTVRRGQPT